MLQSNPFQRYAYYAKIEVTFPQTFALPAEEAIVDGASPALLGDERGAHLTRMDVPTGGCTATGGCPRRPTCSSSWA